MATVLIAEDSPTQAEQLRWLLEGNGFEVLVAGDGEQAIELVKAAKPAVILSDVIMPKVDGYELCRRVKNDPELSGIGFILVTTLSSSNDVFNGLSAGADDFLVKPYQEDQLIQRIRHLLNCREALGERTRGTPIKVELAGKHFTITSNRQQVTNFLISTYEQAITLNEQLFTRQNELKRSNEMVHALYEIADGFNRCHSEADVASSAVSGALRIPGVRGAWLYLRDGNDYWLAGQAGSTGIENEARADERCRCQRLIEDGDMSEAVNIVDCCRMPANSTGGHVSIPLTIAGAPAGVLNLRSDSEIGTFGAEARRILGSIGNQISDALERTRLQDGLEREVDERTRQLNAEVVVRRKAERAAATANQRLLDAINCLTDGFALFDANDHVVVHNRQFADMHVPMDDLIATGARFEALLRSGFCSGGVAPADAELEELLCQHRKADGRPFIQSRGDNWFMMREHRTGEGGVVIIETDITELKRVDIAKDNFLAMVSHELRTPLTPIHGALTLISSGKVTNLTAALASLTDLAQRNCERMIAIVNDLLDFTRIASGRFSLNKKEIEITPFLVDIVENKRIGANAPSVCLTVAPSVKRAKLQADPLRIQQVLDNLLSNAIKFTKPGDRIEVRIDSENGALRVCVADLGPGIPEEFQAKAFDPFAQADSSSTRQKGGVGLGLSISKSIVEAHGGTIGFTSTAGEGTTFYFDLPLMECSGETQAAPTTQEAKRRY